MSDRPWGQTLGALGLRALTGQVALIAEDGHRFEVAFERGAVIGATSPLPVDRAARIAITSHLVPASQLAQVTRPTGEPADPDDVAQVIAAAQLDGDRALQLRRRIHAQRAARTFAVERGAFVVADAVTIPVAAAAALDIRTLVYLGALQYLGDDRLREQLRSLGNHFTLKPDALPTLGQYAMTSEQRPILDHLIRGATLAELELTYAELGARVVHAVVYALACCQACTFTTVPEPAAPPRARTVSALPVTARTATHRTPAPQLTRTPTGQPATARTPTGQPATARTPTTQPAIPRTTTPVATPRTTTPIATARTSTRPSAPPVTTPAASRTPTGNPPVGRTPTTQPIPARTTTEPARARTASNLPPAVGRAPSMSQWADSVPPQPRDAMFGPEDPSATRVMDPLSEAAEAYRRGRAALRDDLLPIAIQELTHATELAPHEFDYAAVLAWAQFRSASDRNKLADKTRKMLGHAVQKSTHPEPARFYLAQMERMLGHDREALRLFQQVLRAEPGNEDAAVEVRMLEAKIAQGGSQEKSGFGGLFRRKGS